MSIKGIAIGAITFFILALAAYICGIFGKPSPKFSTGQVVAVNVGCGEKKCHETYFRVGYVSKRAYEDGTTYYLYTLNDADAPPYWPEESLRPLDLGEFR